MRTPAASKHGNRQDSTEDDQRSCHAHVDARPVLAVAQLAPGQAEKGVVRRCTALHADLAYLTKRAAR